MSRFTRSAGVGSVGRSFEARRRRRQLAEWAQRKSPWRRDAAHPPVFSTKFGIALTAVYADAVREGSHPKAEPRAGRAGVIARSVPRAARSRRTHCSRCSGGCRLDEHEYRSTLILRDYKRELPQQYNTVFVEYGTRRRHNWCRSRDVYVWLPRERWLWCLFNGVMAYLRLACIYYAEQVIYDYVFNFAEGIVMVVLFSYSVIWHADCLCSDAFSLLWAIPVATSVASANLREYKCCYSTRAHKVHYHDSTRVLYGVVVTAMNNTVKLLYLPKYIMYNVRP